MKKYDILSVVMSIVMMLSSCRTDTATADEITTEETSIISASATDSAAAANPDEPEEVMTPRLLYMGQASIRIVTPENKVIYIDPYAGNGYDLAADLILVTHSHFDHNALEKVTERNSDCILITPNESIKDGKHRTFDLGFAVVEAVEAGYNQYHDVRNCVGYIVTLTNGVSIYVTGDTSATKQMPELAEKHIDYAFFCCDGVFNMGLEEAAECAEMVGARHNIPYHMDTSNVEPWFDRSLAEQFGAENRLIIEAGEEIELVHYEEKHQSAELKTETYHLGTDDRIIAYIPDPAASAANGSVPMVLNLHWSGGTPEDQVTENGWIDVCKNEGFIMIAPAYYSWDSVYRHTDYFAEIVKDALTRYPAIDSSRVYVTGFSNGGAAAVALTDQYSELFAAIAPEGWMVGMRDHSVKGKNYDMPFQIIQGSKEYTYETSSGSPAIMTDEQEALRDLMLFNEMCSASYTPDYDAVPYWGYHADKVSELRFDGKLWTVSDFHKAGYDVPFGQLILVEDGIHRARPQHAQLAWDFMKHFRRNSDGAIETV